MEYEIWGMYPPPIGGVSIHIKRLLGALNEIGRVTLKDFKPKDVYTVDFVKPVKNPLKELFILLFSSKRVIHIEQFSYLLFVSLLIFAGRHHYGITIHNQRSVAIRSKVKILLCRIFFKKCSFIIMNDKLFSEKFANKFDVELQKIHILPAFLPPLLSEQKGLPRYVKDFKLKHDFVLSANCII